MSSCILKAFGDDGRSCSNHDAHIRRVGGPAHCAVTALQGGPVSQFVQDLARAVIEHVVAFDAEDFRAHFAQNGGLIARTGAYFQDLVSRFHIHEFGLFGNGERLRDRLTHFDGQRGVFISAMAQGRVNKQVSRYGFKCLQDTLITDPTRNQFIHEHFPALVENAFILGVWILHVM
jgi:hypothetical protein